MNKLTAEKCREQLDECRALKERGYLSINGEYKLQALEIALPVLEQQEKGDDTEDTFIVMRKHGKVPNIKRPAGDIAEYLTQLYQHNPGAVCDVITYRFAGISGQWVQDGKELLAMLEVPQPQDDTYRQEQSSGKHQEGE